MVYREVAERLPILTKTIQQLRWKSCSRKQILLFLSCRVQKGQEGFRLPNVRSYNGNGRAFKDWARGVSEGVRLHEVQGSSGKCDVLSGRCSTSSQCRGTV